MRGSPGATRATPADSRRTGGMVLITVMFFALLLTGAVATFSRRATVDNMISHNREAVSRAEKAKPGASSRAAWSASSSPAMSRRLAFTLRRVFSQVSPPSLSIRGWTPSAAPCRSS